MSWEDTNKLVDMFSACLHDRPLLRKKDPLGRNYQAWAFIVLPGKAREIFKKARKAEVIYIL